MRLVAGLLARLDPHIFPDMVPSRTINREIIRRSTPSSLRPSKIDSAMPATKVKIGELVVIFNVTDWDRDYFHDL
jgi:hypothetical protein